MFKKLDISLPNLELNKLQGSLFIRHVNFVQYNIKDLDYLKSITDKHIKFGINPDTVNVTLIGTPGTRPHSDHWSVSLNHYLTSYNDTTTYWFHKNSNIQSNGLSFFDIDNLIKGESFIAQPHDWYLLDTKAIHSVSISKNSLPRVILRFIWNDQTFENISNSITLL